MTTDELILKTAAVIDWSDSYAFFTRCDKENLFGNGCKHGRQGTYIPFLKKLGRQLNVTIDYVWATGYGFGSSDEVGTAYKLLKQGNIDFLGPDYQLVQDRNESVRSLPVRYSNPHMYYGTRYTGTDYNIFMFADSGLTGLILFTSVMFYFFHFFYLKRQFDISLRISSGSTLAFFVVVNLLLSLFSSRLSAKLTQSREWKPDIRTMGDLRKLLETSSMIVAVRYSPVTRDLTKTLFDPDNPNSASLRQKLRLVNGVDEGLKLAAKHDNVFLIANDVSIYSILWTSICTELTDFTITQNVLSSTKHGFYFSLKSLNRTKRLREYVHKNRYALGAFYHDLYVKYWSFSQSYWRCQESGRYSPSVTLMNAWNTSLKSLIIGLATGLGLLIGENVIDNLKNHVSRFYQ